MSSEELMGQRWEVKTNVLEGQKRDSWKLRILEYPEENPTQGRGGGGGGRGAGGGCGLGSGGETGITVTGSF